MNIQENKKSIFEDSACLAYKELLNYHAGKLNKEDTRKVEKHIAGCELCSSALQGFIALPVNAADLTEIHSKIDSLVKPAPFLSPKGWIISLSSVSLVALIAFFGLRENKIEIVPDNPAPATSYKSPKKEDPISDNMIPAPTVDAVASRTENVPIQRTRFLAKKEIYFSSDAQTSPPEVIPAVEVNKTHVAEENKPVSEEKEEEPLPYEYNAPVRFVEDLMITDFKKYYHEKPGVGIKNKGVDAQFEKDKNEDDFIDKSPSIRADAVLSKALIAFKKGNYAFAVQNFNLLLDVNADDVNSVFYSGLSWLNAGKPEKAIILFDKVLKSENNAFHQEANWYKALALLEKKDVETAKQLLEEIVNEKGFYYKRAKVKLIEAF